MLVEGASALALDTAEEQCDGFTSTWYERTAYRKIPYSSCEGGERPDRGKSHACPGLVGNRSLGALFWGSVAILPFALAGLAGYWWYHKGGRPGYVPLPYPAQEIDSTDDANTGRSSSASIVRSPRTVLLPERCPSLRPYPSFWSPRPKGAGRGLRGGCPSLKICLRGGHPTGRSRWTTMVS